MIEFHLDSRSGVAPYLQLAQQVRQALRMGVLESGDQLPTVREVVGKLAINPNTVQKAYRELEREGLVAGRPGQGTFVQRSLSQSTPGSLAMLSRRLERWIDAARAAGLDDDGIMDLVRANLRHDAAEASA